MSTFSFNPARTLLVVVVLLAASPALHAQTGPKVKIKTKASAAGPVAPQPASPAQSSPQAILSGGATAPTVAAMAPMQPAAAGKEVWLRDLKEAQAQAKATNRPVVAVFSGSDWCKPCIVYEQEVFSKQEFTDYAKDRLVLAHFDFPRLKKNQPSPAQLKLNETAAAQLNHEGDFPLAVIIAPDGKVLAKTGYIAGGPDAFKNYLKKVIPTLE